MVSDRTVLSSFFSREEATQAKQKIVRFGVETAKVEERHRYAPQVPLPDAFLITGNISSLATVTLNETPSSDDAKVLLAADPSASGLSGSPDDSAGRNYILTVICEDEKVDKVVQVIRDCNGFT
ncbi:hypothetical protein JZ785_18685 [Alicyclobacillus curvatus]|jgi:hypothetical protein|nr:hypothetical protein JZ785_18685 [Alicyclobacillus curvatus]